MTVSCDTRFRSKLISLCQLACRVTQMHYKMSFLMGSCIFINQLNRLWKNVNRVLDQDAVCISVFILLWKLKNRCRANQIEPYYCISIKIHLIY